MVNVNSTRSFARAVLRAESSVVIISVSNEPRTYCSGFVLRKTNDEVVVVCPTKFIEEKENRDMWLEVCFSDGEIESANFLRKCGEFCLLSTEAHACECIMWWTGKELLLPSTVFTFIPKSSTRNERKDSYVAIESLEAFSWDKVKEKVKNSDDYLVILCDGPVKNGAPVFTPAGSLGIVIWNYRHEGTGTEMKVVLKANAMKRLLDL